MDYELKHKTNKKISHGKNYPLGAAVFDDGVNFALFSQDAQEVFLLLFDKADGPPTDIIKLANKSKSIWYTFIHGIKPGQLYGYKVKGEYKPAWGLRFNENKLLIDPYSKALTHKFYNKDNLLLGYNPSSPYRDLEMDYRDNTQIVPKSIVIKDDFDWQQDKNPEIPFEKTIIYEVHVKGFTAHKSSGVKQPGTYIGFIEKIPYLKELGITAVEFLPIQEYVVDDFLSDKKLTNYWGYNTIGFFAPEMSYSTNSYPGCQVNEFKTLVRELHKAGIEVIIDVVYNHTSEGNEHGSTICFKGIDNASYYCLTGTRHDPCRYYMNFTGCGNSVNLSNPPVIRFVLDSLRYWAQEMHVDGFRFDLASVLGREEGMFRKSASFFDAISQDPVLTRVKLIAEPWDLGAYEVGGFPVDWAEWNGKYRDNLRKFGKGDSGQIKELGYRLTGSADLYGDDGRTAYSSINFISCHDGFTLNDIVSYNHKHNDANMENNNDGSNDNHSWNCGEEGETGSKDIIALRKKQIKNYGFYLLLSFGTPMLLGGDEFARTQKGNNNAYCQDNDISWYNWDDLKKNEDILLFFKKLIQFRNKHSLLQRKKFLTGIDSDGNLIKDICWYGNDQNPPNWDNIETRTLCYQLDACEVQVVDGIHSAGEDYQLFIILNSDYNSQYIKLPGTINGKKWYRLIDTSLPAGMDFAVEGKETLLNPQDNYIVNSRSCVLLVSRK